MSQSHQNKFGITDTGDFIEYVYHQNESSSIYGKLIGRRPVLSPAQKSFTSADIVQEGYLKKEGSWRKSWKTRYFILRKDIRTLCIFVSKEDLTLIGSIPLNKNVLVFSDARGGGEDRYHTFCVRMGKTSSEEEIVLAAPDEESKAKWMESIMKESTRTEDSIAPDWWRDTFGQIPIMDSKAIGELMHQRRMEERERQQQNAAKLESSHDMSADALAHAMDSRLDIDHHSTKAENARLSLALATFGGVPSNMPAESLFNEKDSDDELDEETADEDDAATVDAVQKSDSKPGRKRREKDAGAATPSKRAVLDESVLSLEGDSDDEKDTTKKKDRINALLARAKKSEAKESKVKTFQEPPLQPATANRHMTEQGFSGIKLCIKIENLSQHLDRLFMVIFKGQVNVEKKSDPKSPGGTGNRSFLSWTPLSRTEEVVVDERSDYSDTVLPSVTKQFALLQGPVEMETASHLMFVLFKNDHNEGTATGGNDYDFESQVVLGKLVVKREVLYTPSGILKFDMNVLDDRSLDLSLSQWSIPKITVGIIILSSHEISSFRNRVISRFPFQPYAEVGYCFRSSKGQGLSMEQLFASPYGLMVSHSLLNLLIAERSKQISDAILIAKDDLASTNADLQELTALALREFLHSNENGGKHHELLLAQPSSYPQFSPITRENQSMYAIGERAAALERLVVTLEAISKLVIAYYGSAHKNISGLASGGPLKNSVLNKICGGNFLRRSVWKKSPSWQFSTINLNVHLMYSQGFPLNNLRLNNRLHNPSSAAAKRISRPRNPDSDDESEAPVRRLSRETFESESAEKNQTSAKNDHLDVFPSFTFGAFAAHALGFHEGGLRRLFSKIQPIDMKVEWMTALQASGGLKYSAIGPLIKHYPEHAESLFSLSLNSEDPAEILSKAFLLCLRIDICIAQALGQAVTAVKTILMLAALGVPGYEEKLKIFLITGFLVPIESLLSSQGHEMGMLEDLDGILPLLNSIVFRLVPGDKSSHSSHDNLADDLGFHLGPSVPGVCVRRDIAGHMVVDISVTKDEESVLRTASETLLGYQEWSTSSAFRYERACPITEPPQCVYKSGSAGPDVIACARVFAIVITQGVNERQTLANMSGESYKQVEINLDAGLNLEAYAKRYIDVLHYFQQLVLIKMQFPSSPEENETTTRSFKVIPIESNKPFAMMASAHAESSKDSEAVDTYDHRIKLISGMIADLSSTIRGTVDNLSEKNVNVLLKASRLARHLCGNMSILCKSGKDRTSMCVTLEEARQLVEGDMDAVGGQEIARVLRRHGVRRMNVWANTGQPMYAFNSIQCQLLPQCFRPPPGTFSGNVQT